MEKCYGHKLHSLGLFTSLTFYYYYVKRRSKQEIIIKFQNKFKATRNGGQEEEDGEWMVNHEYIKVYYVTNR